jgi:hypothetical protein
VIPTNPTASVRQFAHQQRSIQLDEGAPLLGDPTLVISLRGERPKCEVRLPADRGRNLHGRAQPFAQQLWIGV